MTRYEADETDHLDVEAAVADDEQEVGLPRSWNRGDPIPQIPLKQLLEFENEHPGNQLGKEALISTTFHLRAIHYYMQLNRAIDDPAALALDPMLVNRLHDQRRRRLAERASRSFTRK